MQERFMMFEFFFFFELVFSIFFLFSSSLWMILQSKANSKSLNKISDYCCDLPLHTSFIFIPFKGMQWHTGDQIKWPSLVILCLLYSPCSQVCVLCLWGFPHGSMWCCNALSSCLLCAQLANPDSAFSIGAPVFMFLFFHLSHNDYSATHVHSLQRCVEKWMMCLGVLFIHRI